jgi:hypothetical protein
MECIRCGHELWPVEEELCAACAVAVRLEFRRGIEDLEEYLVRWARFADWLETAAT